MPRTGTILAKFLHPRGLVTEARQRKAEAPCSGATGIRRALTEGDLSFGSNCDTTEAGDALTYIENILDSLAGSVLIRQATFSNRRRMSI